MARDGEKMIKIQLMVTDFTRGPGVRQVVDRRR